MAELLSIGLESLKIGAIAGDGGMGTTLAALGNTYENTCSMVQEDAESTEFFAEEVDDPVYVISKKGKTILEWAIMDWTPSVIVQVLGGTVTGTGAAAVWKAPSDIPEVERSIELVTKTDVQIDLPRVKLEGRLDSSFTRNEPALVRIRGTILTPTKVGEPPVMISKA